MVKIVGYLQMRSDTETSYIILSSQLFERRFKHLKIKKHKSCALNAINLIKVSLLRGLGTDYHICRLWCPLTLSTLEDHKKQLVLWVVHSLKFLSSVFSIQMFAIACMWLCVFHKLIKFANWTNVLRNLIPKQNKRKLGILIRNTWKFRISPHWSQIPIYGCWAPG